METANSVVLVTGFGPFHHHTVNASWAAVKELQNIGVWDVDSDLPVPLAIKRGMVIDIQISCEFWRRRTGMVLKEKRQDTL